MIMGLRARHMVHAVARHVPITLGRRSKRDDVYVVPVARRTEVSLRPQSKRRKLVKVEIVHLCGLRSHDGVVEPWGWHPRDRRPRISRVCRIQKCSDALAPRKEPATWFGEEGLSA